MAKLNSLRKDFFISILIGDQNGFSWRLVSFLLLISLLPYLGAIFDHSFFLPGKSVGILKHYGNICFTIIFPLVLLFVIQGIRCFDHFVSNIETNIVKDKYGTKVKLDELLHTILDENRYAFLKILFIIIGFIFATVNAINTLMPEEIWGHDVYDSVNHIRGYIAQRIFFYVWWAYILPIFIYRLFAIVISLNRLFRSVIDTDSLDLQPMHPDNAGGLGELGLILKTDTNLLLSDSAQYPHRRLGPLVHFTHFCNYAGRNCNLGPDRHTPNPSKRRHTVNPMLLSFSELKSACGLLAESVGLRFVFVN
jgi:hypothetical protein